MRLVHSYCWIVLVAGVWLSAALPVPARGQTPGIPFPSSQFAACDFCLASQGISPLEAGSTGMRIDFRYLSLGTWYVNDSRSGNTEHELETHLTEQASFLWSLSPRLTLDVLIPVPKRHSEHLADDGSVVTGNQIGLGDISLLARYRIIVQHDMDKSLSVAIDGGIKAPTGSTNGKDSRGDLLDPHIQLGTGSTDFLAGANAFAAFDRTALIGNLLGAFTTQGAQGHRFGNSVNYDVSVRYRLYPDDYDFPQFFLTFGAAGEYRARESFGGVADQNSGGHVVYLTPGAQLFIAPSLTIELSYQPAVFHHLNGQQLGEDYRLTSGILFLF